MGKESQIKGQEFEGHVEQLLRLYKLTYSKNYDVQTVVGLRKIDFIVITKAGRVLIETKNRGHDDASRRAAAMELFTVMYEYKLLFPNDRLLAIVNDMDILKPGKQNYASLLSSIGVEVVAFENNRPGKYLQRKLEELKKES